MIAKQIRRAARSAVQVAGVLERNGCLVLSAHANAGGPVVSIDQPPSGLFSSWGYIDPPPGPSVPVRCAAHLCGVLVTWVDTVNWRTNR